MSELVMVSNLACFFNTKDFWGDLSVISCQSWRLWGISPNESGKLLRDNDYIGWSSNPRTPNRHAWHKRLVTGFEVSFVLRMEKNISLIPLQAIVGSLFRIEDWSQHSHTAREIMSIMCIFYSASSSQKKSCQKKNPPSMHPLSLWNITRLYKCSLFMFVWLKKFSVCLANVLQRKSANLHQSRFFHQCM